LGSPQPPQNFAVPSFWKPQVGHDEGSGDPHSAQKRLVAAFSAMQLGQCIWCTLTQTDAVRAQLKDYNLQKLQLRVHLGLIAKTVRTVWPFVGKPELSSPPELIDW
jgi:hypothetical protein